MISNPMELGALTHRLTTNAWTLAALAALFESGLVEQLREPRTVEELVAATSLPANRVERCLGMCAAVGVIVSDGPRHRLADGVMPATEGARRRSFQGELRSTLMQALAYLDAMANRDSSQGWTHTDPRLLQAQGDSSGIFGTMFKCNVAPTLGDLASRLERPGARFLDVGFGVGALAIGMCDAYPEVQVVGIDHAGAPLAVARDAIAKRGLGSRIEVREMPIQELRDEAAFDLAWVPSFFIPEAILPAALARVAAALRPGGWIVTGGFGTGDDQARAMQALVNDLWGGGPVLGAAGMESRLTAAGLSNVRAMPGPPWMAMVVGQR